ITPLAAPIPPPSEKTVPKPSLTQQFALGIKKIVIDPGHGGHDAGAIGYKGMKEKDVVLDIGKVLRDILAERLGVEVVMTRDTDVFIPLEERTAIANTVGADLFISVHANASRNKNAGGIETYFLNFAKDEDSMRLAAAENATTTKNMSDLQAILNDLMLNSKINESSKLARYVQGSMLDVMNGNGSKAKDRGVRQAPFYVLIGAQMPSILIETSFITNKEDARRLADQVFQKTIAKAIAGGIEKYSEVVKVASSQ
ncbi:MAG: N-acetylmuramoyl-L-alanine amidase, partial [Deltaproteobacteria bacterium]